jgi:Tfp pilus assembly protein PilF
MSQSTIVAAGFTQAIIAINELIARGDYKKATAECDNLISTYPDAIRALRARAHALERLGDAAHALDDYRRVVDMTPTDYHSLMGMVRCHKRLGENRDAQAVARQVLEYDPYDLEAAQFADINEIELRRAGKIRDVREGLYAGKFNRSINEIKKHLENDADRVDLWLILAQTLWQNKQLVQAATVCHKILYSNPACLGAHLLLRQIWQTAHAQQQIQHHSDILAMIDPDQLEAYAWAQSNLLPEAQSVFTKPLEEGELYDRDIQAPPASHSPEALTPPEIAEQEIEDEDLAPEVAIDIIGEYTPEAEEDDANVNVEKAYEPNLEDDADYDQSAWVNDLIAAGRRNEMRGDSPEEFNDETQVEGVILPPEKLEWSVVYSADVENDELADDDLPALAVEPEPEPEWLANLRAQSESAWVPADEMERMSQLTSPAQMPSGSAVLGDDEAWEEEDGEVLRGVKLPSAKRAATVSKPVDEQAHRAKRVGKKERVALENLKMAQTALIGGNVDSAIEIYADLVKQGRRLDEVIADLGGVAQNPQCDLRIFRLLGDAHTKSGNAKAALAAYQKGLKRVGVNG